MATRTIYWYGHINELRMFSISVLINNINSVCPCWICIFIRQTSGELGPHLMPGYWDPPEFTPKTDLNCGIRSVEFTVVISIQHTQLHTDTQPHYVCGNWPHFVLCVAMQTKLQEKQLNAIQHILTGLLLSPKHLLEGGWCRSSKKIAHTRLPSLGFRSWFRFLAVSQQVTWIITRPDGRLPLLSVRPAVTPTTLKKAATNFAAWWTEARWV